MMGVTHALIGASVGLLLMPSAAPLDHAAAGALCAVAALLPDVDHPQSLIRGKMGFAGDLAFGWFGHRGITHSLVAVALVALGAFALLPHPVAVIISAGYCSHLVADGITRGGIPLFAPLNRKRYGLHLMTTGGLLEQLLAGALMLGLIAVLIAPLVPDTMRFLREAFDHACGAGLCL